MKLGYPRFSWPPGDQVHVPQVRPFRNHREQGRPLRPRPEHHQREDLHLPLVLVSHLKVLKEKVLDRKHLNNQETKVPKLQSRINCQISQLKSHWLAGPIDARNDFYLSRETANKLKA